MVGSGFRHLTGATHQCSGAHVATPLRERADWRRRSPVAYASQSGITSDGAIHITKAAAQLGGLSCVRLFWAANHSPQAAIQLSKTFPGSSAGYGLLTAQAVTLA